MAQGSSNESDIRSSLSSIDNQKLSTQMNSLHTVAASELPSGRVYATEHVTEIFDILKESHSCADSLTVLIRMMEAANFKSTHIKKLSAHLPQKPSETQQADSDSKDGELQVEEHEHVPNFSFQKVLVDLAEELGNDNLRKVVNSLTDKEIGTSADNIKTPHELFRSMVHAESIVHGDWSSLNLLVSKLEAVGLTKQANAIRIKIQSHTSQQESEDDDDSEGNCTQIERHIQGDGMLNNSEVGEALADEDALEKDRTGSFTCTVGEESHEFGSLRRIFRNNSRNRNCRKRCTTICTCCIIVTAVCLTAIVLAAIGVAVYSPLFVSDQSDSMNVYRNITYLAFGEGVNTRFYDRVTFNLSSTAAEESISFSIQVCQIDCTHSNPKTLINRLNYHDTIVVKTTQTLRRFYARFSDQHDMGIAALLSEYMLSTSNISITVDYHSNDSTLDGAISLFLFDNVNNCEDFFSVATDQGENAIRTYTLGNGDVSSITVPKDGFYCAVWDISVAANFSYQYTIESDILLYDIEHYLNQDTMLCSEPRQSLHPFEVAVMRNHFKDVTKCFLVFQSHSDNINVTVESTAVVAHTKNSFFILSIPVIIFVLLLCFCMIILMIICYVRKCFCFRRCSV